MQRPERRSLRALALAGDSAGRFLADDTSRVPLVRLATGWSLAAPPETLRGCTALVTTGAQLPTVLAALDLDGIAARILLCPPDLPAGHLPAVLHDAQVDVVVTDGTGLTVAAGPGMRVVGCSADATTAAAGRPEREMETEWVLFTSGTTGRPKMVRHTLASLTGPLQDGLVVPSGAVWSTFYDVRRYGGLQILLRALLGGGSMVLSSAQESVADFLARAGTEGVTHISGTPSHWRRALMSPAADAMAPAYVRLSGEVADQAILDRLALAYPASNVAHAYASTEAGVAFDVRDGLAGFPASVLESTEGGTEMHVVDGTLRIRSGRVSAGYLGDDSGALDAPGGFVDTGDMVQRRGDRYYFVGRREGVINVGGEKVYPEEVEAILNRHAAVRMSRVWARSSPVTGAIVAADLVLESGHDLASIREDLLEACRDALPAHKVPATLRQVASLPITVSGKLVRHA